LKHPFFRELREADLQSAQQLEQQQHQAELHPQQHAEPPSLDRCVSPIGVNQSQHQKSSTNANNSQNDKKTPPSSHSTIQEFTPKNKKNLAPHSKDLKESESVDSNASQASLPLLAVDTNALSVSQLPPLASFTKTKTSAKIKKYNKTKSKDDKETKNEKSNNLTLHNITHKKPELKNNSFLIAPKSISFNLPLLGQVNEKNDENINSGSYTDRLIEKKDSVDELIKINELPLIDTPKSKKNIPISAASHNSPPGVFLPINSPTGRCEEPIQSSTSPSFESFKESGISLPFISSDPSQKKSSFSFSSNPMASSTSSIADILNNQSLPTLLSHPLRNNTFLTDTYLPSSPSLSSQISSSVENESLESLPSIKTQIVPKAKFIIYYLFVLLIFLKRSKKNRKY
jgi:hypothetical protein